MEDLGLGGPRRAVAEPQAGAPAAKAGIESGDVIVAINGKEIDSRGRENHQRLPPGTTAAIGVIRRARRRRSTSCLAT